MAEKKSLVRNAADPEQVGKAKEREQFTRDDELNDLRAVLAMPEGRRFAWRMLEQCKTFESIFETSARIYYNAGRQDLGHFILAEVAEADPELWLMMQREANRREQNKTEPVKRTEDTTDTTDA